MQNDAGTDAAEVVDHVLRADYEDVAVEMVRDLINISSPTGREGEVSDYLATRFAD